MVRIWQPADDVTDAGLHGTVECVRSATSEAFADREELVRIIESQLAARAAG